MTKTIAFANIKGGTGKTTTCVNIAGYLVKRGEKSQVLVVDFDPQANATSGLGIDATTLEYSIYDAVLEQCDGYEGVPVTQCILQTDVENLHLLPSELNLSAITMVLQQTEDRVSILNRILEPVRQYYDYILIDVPSDAGLFLLNSLWAADQVIVPLDSSVFALEALENLNTYCDDIEQMRGHGLKPLTIVLNRYTRASSSSQKKRQPSPSEEIESALKEQSYTVFAVPESLLVYRSQQAGLPVSHLTKTTGNLGKAYEAIANDLATSK